MAVIRPELSLPTRVQLLPRADVSNRLCLWPLPPLNVYHGAFEPDTLCGNGRSSQLAVRSAVERLVLGVKLSVAANGSQ